MNRLVLTIALLVGCSGTDCPVDAAEIGDASTSVSTDPARPDAGGEIDASSPNP